MHEESRVDQRGQDPEQELGIGGAIAFAHDALVDGVDQGGGLLCLPPRAEDYGQRGLEGAHQPLALATAKRAVLGDSGCDLGVCHLHQEGAAATKEHNAFAVDAADDGVRRKEGLVRRPRVLYASGRVQACRSHASTILRRRRASRRDSGQAAEPFDFR